MPLTKKDNDNNLVKEQRLDVFTKNFASAIFSKIPNNKKGEALLNEIMYPIENILDMPNHFERFILDYRLTADAIYTVENNTINLNIEATFENFLNNFPRYTPTSYRMFLQEFVNLYTYYLFKQRFPDREEQEFKLILITDEQISSAPGPFAWVFSTAEKRPYKTTTNNHAASKFKSYTHGAAFEPNPQPVVLMPTEQTGTYRFGFEIQKTNGLYRISPNTSFKSVYDMLKDKYGKMDTCIMDKDRHNKFDYFE